MSKKEISLEDIASLCKRRGFIFQGSEIYGGLAGTWDYGPLGVQLKRNITDLWWKTFVENRADMYGIDAAILMNQKVWQASGHVGGFHDPLVEDLKTKKRYRADHLLEDAGIEGVTAMSLEQMDAVIKEKNIKSPDGNALGDVRQFNMMFKTQIGATDDATSVSYLRPETAQGMFVNFKNVIDSFYPDIPFGMGQIGKAFRNEISPRDFIFRVREFEQMEIEYFVHPDSWKEHFDYWLDQQKQFLLALGLPPEKIHPVDVPKEDRAHYSKWSVDTEFDFPFGQKELLGCAYRTDHDLNAHQKDSGKSMEYRPKDGSAPFVPHVIEPTFGLDRVLLAVLSSAYTEDELNGEKRTYLKLAKHLAPVKAAVSPLLKNKPELVAKAQEVYQMLQANLGAVTWDDNSNVGKRYRRSDEIGVPAHITIDFQTLEDGTVTVRDRDTAQQTRVKIEDLTQQLR
ncbi:MAG TPA: glycine--tRNA ligase [Candidatus Saccharimonadales bacterium]|nr:glycine--tRNA ligase [Candidatus Saccharimonadales bacterium]